MREDPPAATRGPWPEHGANEGSLPTQRTRRTPARSGHGTSQEFPSGATKDEMAEITNGIAAGATTERRGQQSESLGDWRGMPRSKV